MVEMVGMMEMVKMMEFLHFGVLLATPLCKYSEMGESEEL